METRCGRLFQQIISIATRPAKHYKGTFYFFRETQTVSFILIEIIYCGLARELVCSETTPSRAPVTAQGTSRHKQARFYLTVTTVV